MDKSILSFAQIWAKDCILIFFLVIFCRGNPTKKVINYRRSTTSVFILMGKLKLMSLFANSKGNAVCKG